MPADAPSTRAAGGGPATLLRWAPGLVVVVALLVLALDGGVGLADVLRYAGRIVLGVLFPGVILARLVRVGRRTGVEDLAVGYAVGTVVQVPVWALLLRLDASYWLWPAALAAVVAATPALRRRVLDAPVDRVPTAWAWSVAAACLVTLAWLRTDFLRWNPPEPGTAHTYYPDLVFHLGLAGDALHRVPPSSPQVAGEPLHYHWLAHLDLAVGSSASGVDLATVLFQLWVPVTLLAGLVALAACGSRISRQLWAGPLAVVLAYVASEAFLASWLPGPFSPLTLFAAWASPSHTIETVVALPLVGVLADALRREEGSRRQLVLLGIPLTLGAALAKSSLLPVVVCGLLAVGAWALLTRRRRLVASAAVATVVVVGSFGAALVVFYGGQGGGLALDPLAWMSGTADRYLPDGGPTAVWIVLAVWVVSVLARAGGVLLLLPRWRTVDPVQVLCVGALAGGIGAYLLLAHPGGSQLYFLIRAFPLGVLASAWAVLERVPAPAPRTVRGLALGTLVLGVALFALVPVIGDDGPPSGAVLARTPLLVVGLALVALVVLGLLHRRGILTDLRRAPVLLALTIAVGLPGTLVYAVAPEAGTSVAERYAARSDTLYAVTAPGLEAAHWVRDQTPDDAILATNRHCAETGDFPGTDERATRCSVLSFWVSAYTERRVLVEGWGYSDRAVTASIANGVPFRLQPFWDPELLQLNDSLFRRPTAGKVRRICAAGATYAFLDRRASPDLPPLDDVATRVFATADAEVYLLPC